MLRFSTPLVIVGALFLASCSGGGSGTGDQKDPPPTTPLSDAVDAQAAAAAARKEAMRLSAAAITASENLSAIKVNGASQKAHANALNVLGATALVNAQLTEAEAAYKKANDIDTTGMTAAQSQRIASAVSEAEADVDEIKDILKADGKLAMAVESVKLGSKTSDTDAMIATAKADLVAAAIKGAINNDAGDALRALDVGGSSSNDAVKTTSNSGMTFAQIAGGKTMATTSTKGFTTTATGTTIVTGTIVSGEGTDAFYMGIQGDLVCLPGSTCSAATDGAITGNVQFVPSDQTKLWAKTSIGGNYAEVTNVGSYGYWLAASTGADIIKLHASSKSTANTLLWNRAATATKDVDATYSGKAGGYSVRTIGTGTDAKDHSGEFTANAELTATFQQTAGTNLSGSISGFSGGDHVNPNWYVRMMGFSDVTEGVFNNGTVTSGGRKHDATAGAWNAFGYGEADKNPTGFVGGFSASFADGVATGVYQVNN